MPPLFPEGASNHAASVDTLYFVLITLTLVFVLPITFTLFYFAIKYHRSHNANRAGPKTGNLKVELAWTFGPFVLSMIIFCWSAYLYARVYGAAPPDAIEIYVIGKQWMWKAQHPQGKRENNELHVPIGVPIRIIATSQDVIHSFFIPAFRIKRDVLPGRYTSLWFEATQVGEYHLFCAEYCGTEHAKMIGTITVMQLNDYQAWLQAEPDPLIEPIAPDTSSEAMQDAVEEIDVQGPMAVQGARLFQQHACISCHRLDGSGVGPTLVGLYGSQIRFLDSEVVTADENYIRESILKPQARVLPGYQPIMPTFEGQLNEEELNELIAYIKSLVEAPERSTQ